MFFLNEFFQKLLLDADNPIIEILKARGFLIHQIGVEYYLSDNSEAKDARYLSRLLWKYHIGSYTSCTIHSDSHPENNSIGQITVVKNAKVEDAICLFNDSSKISFPSIFNFYKWNYFLNRKFGVKCYIKDLEPYVARYI